MYTHPQHSGGEEAQVLRKQAGGWLRHLREARGLSQRQLAEKVGIDYYTFVSQIEAGRGRIPPDRCERWALALGMAPAEFTRALLRYYDPITFRLLFGEPDSEIGGEIGGQAGAAE